MEVEEGVKFRIFMFTYNTQFWSYDNVVNMFLDCVQLKKHLRTLSEHSEENLKFLVDLKLLHGLGQVSSRKVMFTLSFPFKEKIDRVGATTTKFGDKMRLESLKDCQ